jgi:hypothetical protein
MEEVFWAGKFPVSAGEISVFTGGKRPDNSAIFRSRVVLPFCIDLPRFPAGNGDFS